MRDIGEHWGENDLPDQPERYCLRCQEILLVLDGVPWQCPTCGAAFSPHDPNTFASQAVRNRLAIWLPVATCSLVLMMISGGVAFAVMRNELALLAILPAPLGLVPGYFDSRKGILAACVFVFLVFATTICIASGTIWAFPTAICAGAIVIAPVGLGFVMGRMLRQLLLQSRWRQRRFL